MIDLLILFADNILPILLVAGAGYLLSKYTGLSPRPVSQVAFYIFSPCLIFTLLTTSSLSGDDIFRIVGFATVTILTLGAITWLVGRAMHLDRRILAAVLLTVMFGNAGNFGLSLNLFAFGESALAYASLYFVTAAALTYTVGVFIASMGNSSPIQAIANLRKIPAIYAVGLALLFNAFHWSLPVPVNRGVTLLSDAAIPTLMVLLGIQLQHSQLSNHLKALTLANGMRLLAGPALALLFSLVFGLQGVARQAGISESAVPTAVVTTVLATEFDVEPAFVTTVVFISTLISPLTVTPLLAYLGA